MKRINRSQPKTLAPLILLLVSVASASAKAEWSIDLSRRTQNMRKQELSREPSSVRTYEGDGIGGAEAKAAETKRSRRFDPAFDPTNEAAPKEDITFLERVLDPGEPAQDIVILSTDHGFVPNTIRVRRDGRYNVHVVNVNEKEKNVSFMLDGFSENHATFFGRVKTFKLEPKKEGVYSFMSPETAMEGRFIVYASGPATPPTANPALRRPAQTGSDSMSAPHAAIGGSGR